jgi:hypothetical protein
MITHDAKSQTPRTWTDQEERWGGNDGGSCQGTGRDSNGFRSQSFPITGDDWTQTDPIDNTGGLTLGGTIQQLINETRDEITEISSRHERLQKRLTQLEKLLHQLENNSETLNGIE